MHISYTCLQRTLKNRSSQIFNFSDSNERKQYIRGHLKIVFSITLIYNHLNKCHIGGYELPVYIASFKPQAPAAATASSLMPVPRPLGPPFFPSLEANSFSLSAILEKCKTLLQNSFKISRRYGVVPKDSRRFVYFSCLLFCWPLDVATRNRTKPKPPIPHRAAVWQEGRRHLWLSLRTVDVCGSFHWTRSIFKQKQEFVKDLLSFDNFLMEQFKITLSIIGWVISRIFSSCQCRTSDHFKGYILLSFQFLSEIMLI